MRPINVLWAIDHVCYDGSLHGGGRLFWNLLPEFDAQRVRVVACLLRASEQIRTLFARSPAPVRILGKRRFDPTTVATFLRLIKGEKIDVMHLHCYGASTFGRIAGVLTGVPAVVQDYDTEVYFPYPSYLGVADSLLAPATARAIAASSMVRRFQVTRRKIPEDRISLMFHAVPPEKFEPVSAERIQAVRARLGADASTRIIGTVTKLGPQRGNSTLVDAAAEVLKSAPDVLFVVVYKPTHFHRLPSKKYVEVTELERGTLVTGLVKRAKELAIERSIRFIEWPDSLQEFMAACEFMVVPFLSERFSSVNLLESLAMGKPVIATDLGEQQEIIRNGFNGYLVPPGDVPAMAQRIVALLRDPTELEGMARRAREDALRYSVRGNARWLEQLYAGIARRPPFDGDDAAVPGDA